MSLIYWKKIQIYIEINHEGTIIPNVIVTLWYILGKMCFLLKCFNEFRICFSSSDFFHTNAARGLPSTTYRIASSCFISGARLPGGAVLSLTIVASCSALAWSSSFSILMLCQQLKLSLCNKLFHLVYSFLYFLLFLFIFTKFDFWKINTSNIKLLESNKGL